MTAALVSVHLFLLTAGVALGAAPPAKPPIPVNLISNSDFEIDNDRDGIPDGWSHSEPQYWCGPAKDSPLWKKLHALWKDKGWPAKIPFRPPDISEGGAYEWVASGRKSGHAISIDETTQQMWGEWDTIVKGIKANTDYVIMGWRRQSAPLARKPGVAPWMSVAAFGKMTAIRGTIDKDLWAPFVISVNSGSFSGDCSIGVIVNRVPAKVWIDQVVMFAGGVGDIPRFRLGHKGAAFEYPFHDVAYASPDLECPLFFDVMWSFHGGNGDPGLELVVDLPQGLDLTGGECGMGLEFGKFTAKSIQIEGRPYVRRTVPIINAKDRAEFDSAGKRPVHLWLEIPKKDLTQGTFEAFYHARWRGGRDRQAIQPLTVKVIRVSRVKQPSSLIAGIGDLSRELVTSRTTKLAGSPTEKALPENGLPARGLNCIVLDSGLDPKVAQQFEKAGISPAAWFRLGQAKPPADAIAMDVKGKPVPGQLCPCYRPKDAIKTLFAEPAALVKDGTTTLFTDLRNGRRGTCFCPRCVKEFQAFLKKDRPKLKYVPPAEFVADLEKFKEHNDAWQEFRAAKLADLYWTLRKKLDEFRKAANPPVRNAASPLRLLAVVPTPSLGASAVRQGSMVDYAKLALVFDVEVIQPGLYLPEAGGTPAWVGDEVARLVNALPVGGKAGVMVTAGSWDDRAAAAPVVRRPDVRDQVLEAVVAGAKAVILRPFYAVDGMDIQQFTAALGLLAPFEDIIAEGEPVKKILSVADGKASVRCFGKEGQMLVLVSDYSARPAAEVKLAVNFPAGGRRQQMVLVDVESARVVAKKITGATKGLTLPLQGSRARLFYLGPQSKLPDLRRKK